MCGIRLFLAPFAPGTPSSTTLRRSCMLPRARWYTAAMRTCIWSTGLCAGPDRGPSGVTRRCLSAVLAHSTCTITCPSPSSCPPRTQWEGQDRTLPAFPSSYRGLSLRRPSSAWHPSLSHTRWGDLVLHNYWYNSVFYTISFVAGCLLREARVCPVQHDIGRYTRTIFGSWARRNPLVGVCASSCCAR